MKMSNEVFDVLRTIEAIFAPLVTFITALSEIWGFEYGIEVAATFAALNVAFGTIIERLRSQYNKKTDEK